MKKYSDLLAEWLVALGYTHCFFVAGGHIMHLLESCSRRFICVPVVHEVAAGIAAEYFNEVQLGGKAFALVTSGPGLTNIVTALAGAFLESRELLVIGGQVKTADLSRGNVRQRGIQEIDGVALAARVTVCSTNSRLTRVLLMIGTIFFALSPLYLTRLHDAIYDGALLIVAIAFLADAIFRCVNPANRLTNRSLFFFVFSLCMLALCLLQYGPIANDLRKEKIAEESSVRMQSIDSLSRFEQTRTEDEENLPNSSVALLICSILVEFSVILVVET